MPRRAHSLIGSSLEILLGTVVVCVLKSPPPPVLPPTLRRWSTNRIAMVYLSLAMLLLPWLVVLAFKLPDRQISQHYRLAWVGFDLMLMATLSRTAWLAWRRSPYLVIVASMTATLLIVDAWFDITTAASDPDRNLAILTAVVIELPLSVFSMSLARRAQRVIAIVETADADSARLK